MDLRNNRYIKLNSSSGQLSFVVIASVLFTFISKYNVFAFRYSVLIYLLIICLIPILNFLFYSKNAVRINFPRFFYFMFTVALIANSFTGSNNFTDSFFFAFNKFLMFFLLYYLSLKKDWETTFKKYATICGKVLVLSVLIEVIQPSLISSINSMIMSSEDYATYISLYNKGYHLGISIQASYLAFNVSIIISLLSGLLLTNNGHKSDLLWIVLSVLVVILSGKRADFLGVILSFLFTAIIMVYRGNLSLRKKIWIVSLSMFLSTTIFYFLFYTTYGALLFEKGMTFTYDTTRTYLLNEGIDLWQKRPVVGNGTNYFSQHYELSTHNTYLQMLCDNGLIGLTLFVGFVFVNIIQSISVFFKLNLNNIKSSLLLSSIFFQSFFLISAFFESMFSNDVMWIIYIVMISIPYSIKNSLAADGKVYQ